MEFFTKKKIKVKDVALGEFHSLALSEDGKIYSWGYGGSTGIWAYFSQSIIIACFLKSIKLDIGALGHGDQITHYLPK